MLSSSRRDVPVPIEAQRSHADIALAIHCLGFSLARKTESSCNARSAGSASCTQTGAGWLGTGKLTTLAHIVASSWGVLALP